LSKADLLLESAFMVDWFGNFFDASWELTMAMAPWLLLGFAMAGICSRLVSRKTIERHIAGNNIGSVLKAVGLGIPLPLCSCGVIPVAASLRQKGASKGSVAAFTAATPQTGVDSIAATYSLMGWIFMLGRLLADLIAGILAGVLINLLVGDKTKPEVVPAAPQAGSQAKSCCAHKATESPAPTPKNWIAILHDGFVKMPADIGNYLVIGILLGALITTLMPPDSLKEHLGHPLWSYVVITLVAIPLYVCATGSIPLAFAMMQVGISPGAAIVFLVAGPATNTATFVTLLKLIGKRATLIYLVTLIVGAWSVGLIFDYTIPRDALQLAHTHHHGTESSWFDQLSGAVLIAILAYALLPWRKWLGR
jgi:uncharacterized membrane protein YraQ (UPF0718 family)